MVQNDISSVVHARCQVLHRTSAKLVNAEDQVFGVGDSVNVILEYINAERVENI